MVNGCLENNNSLISFKYDFYNFLYPTKVKEDIVIKRSSAGLH